MKKLLLILWLIGVFLPGVPLEAYGQSSQRGVILIISSYNPDTRRMSSFISDFEQAIVSSGVPYDIYIENLECRGVADASIWMEQMENVIRRYETKGLVSVILLGQEAWASFMSLNRFPEGIQIFGCFASTNGVLLPPPPDSGPDNLWMPESMNLKVLADSLSHNLAGGLLNNYDIRGNIDLITSLYPEVENIAFISDNTYGGISLQALVRQEMAEHYPRLRLELIDSRAGDSIVHHTYAALPARSAALIGTWRVGCDGEYLMQRSLTDLVRSNPAIPVFSVTGSGIGEVAVGGCVPEYDNGALVIAKQIVQAHKHGVVAKSTYFQLTSSKYLFDARKLKELKIAEYSLPKGSIVEDALAAQLSKYSHYISILLVALAAAGGLLAFIVVLLLRTRRLTHTLSAREGELVVAREKAEESDRLKSAFLANMSHEIRTPLNAIVGFSSLMGSDELSCEERAEYGSIIINNSEMLLTLLNDILDISSLEIGKTRFVYTEENVVEICRHVMMTTVHTRAAGVEGVFDPPCESLMLVTDIHRLSQILINLLTNASKFTSQGSIKLAFEVRERERMVYFSVTDTGSGIPHDKQEAVFNRFEKLYGNQKKGTGLGLAICRQTVTIFGGRIWVDPTYTEGARFIFTHPLDLKVTPPPEEGMGHTQGTSKGPQI